MARICALRSACLLPRSDSRVIPKISTSQTQTDLVKPVGGIYLVIRKGLATKCTYAGMGLKKLINTLQIRCVQYVVIINIDDYRGPCFIKTTEASIRESYAIFPHYMSIRMPGHIDTIRQLFIAIIVYDDQLPTVGL